MKKITIVSTIVLMSLAVFPHQIVAKSAEVVATTNNASEAPADVQNLLHRLAEIKEIDKSSLNASEKKKLRTEVRAIKSSLSSTGNGIYLSLGAIVIIVLLLILIL